jgi:hypothetical protein
MRLHDRMRVTFAVKVKMKVGPAIVGVRVNVRPLLFT